MKALSVLLLLFLISACCSEPSTQPRIIEKILVQCWDSRIVESADKCPPIPKTMPEQKAADISDYSCSENLYNCADFKTHA